MKYIIVVYILVLGFRTTGLPASTEYNILYILCILYLHRPDRPLSRKHALSTASVITNQINNVTVTGTIHSFEENI